MDGQRMNWPRGLLRVWAVLSGFWATAVAASYVLLVVMDEPPVHLRLADVPVSWVCAIALFPPALALALGLAGVWIVRGFQRDS
jgi:hypothetical protein